MIRVAIFDAHPAARSGLERIVTEARALALAGAAADARALWPLLYRADPDVLVLGTDRPADGLRLCQRARTRHPRVRVVLYAAQTGFDTVVPARFAGAHAVVDKSARVADLVAAIRSPDLPPLTPLMQRRAAAPLEPADRAILAMALAGTPAREIGAVVGLGAVALAARRAQILAALCGSGSAAAGPLDGARELHAR
jgi:DNA-binding NarL/FixJ family response regulator